MYIGNVGIVYILFRTCTVNDAQLYLVHVLFDFLICVSDEQISNLLFLNPKFHGPNPKSKPQIPILELKIPIKSPVLVFPQLHKHEL